MVTWSTYCMVLGPSAAITDENRPQSKSDSLNVKGPLHKCIWDYFILLSITSHKLQLYISFARDISSKVGKSQ